MGVDRKHKRLIGGLLAAALGSLVVAVSPGPVESRAGSLGTRLCANVASPAAPMSARIVYEKNDGIYSINPDGSDERRLTKDASDWFPSWSPTGSRIAFTRHAEYEWSIFAMNADGTAVTRLTDEESRVDLEATWSPDGRYVAFTAQGIPPPHEVPVDVFRVGSGGLDTGTRTLLVRRGWSPDWSPDGNRIAFVSDRDQARNGDIYAMNANGSGVTRLTYDRASDRNPDWSPDGSKIAFARNEIEPNTYNFNIYTMNADGSGVTRLTDDPADDREPSWSPDGSRIAFTNQGNLYTMNADGSDRTLIQGSGNNYSLDWSWASRTLLPCAARSQSTGSATPGSSSWSEPRT